MKGTHSHSIRPQATSQAGQGTCRVLSSLLWIHYSCCVCTAVFFIGEGRERMVSKRSVFNCLVILALLVGLGACQPQTNTTPVAAAQTGTPTPSREVPVYDSGPIPEVHINCLFQRQGETILQQEEPRAGSWRQFRQNAKLTGRSPLIGDITCPKLLWAYDLGARQTCFNFLLNFSGFHFRFYFTQYRRI